jgi:hypothetical protein
MARTQESNKKEWASKVLALIKGGNTSAAISQIKVAPSVKDLKQLQAALILAKLQPAQPAVDTVIADQIDALLGSRLHRSP